MNFFFDYSKKNANIYPNIYIYLNIFFFPLFLIIFFFNHLLFIFIFSKKKK